MGFLGSLFQVGVPQLAGRAEGQVQGQLLARRLQQEEEERRREAEDRQRAMQQDALRLSLLQAQIANAQRPGKFEPRSFQEAVDFANATRPPAAERNLDPLSSAGIAAALRRRRGERQIDQQFPGPPPASERDAESEGQAILAQMGREGTATNAQKLAFARSFNAVLTQNPTLSPGRVALLAFRGSSQVDPTLKPVRPPAPGSSAAFNQQLMAAIGGDSTDGASDALVLPNPPPAPVAPVPPPSPAVGGRATVTGSPAERWEELVAGGLDPAAATAQVKQEFGLP